METAEAGAEVVVVVDEGREEEAVAAAAEEEEAGGTACRTEEEAGVEFGGGDVDEGADSLGGFESSTSIGLAVRVGREAELDRERLRPRGREDCFTSLLCLRRLDLLVERGTPLTGGRLSLEEERVTIVDGKANRET